MLQGTGSISTTKVLCEGMEIHPYGSSKLNKNVSNRVEKARNGPV